MAKPLPITVTDELKERFWNMVKKGDGCWEWQGIRDAYGYGRVFDCGRGLRSSSSSNRVSFAIHYYDPPLDMEVCHTCDNPACVRPEHLVLGTAKENAVDALHKGRLATLHRNREIAPYEFPAGSTASTLMEKAELDAKIAGMVRDGLRAPAIARILRMPEAAVNRVVYTAMPRIR